MQWLPENPTFVKLFAITIFVKGTTPKNEIEVLEEDAKNKKLQLIQEVKDGIKIMIEPLADSDLQDRLTKIYK